MLNKPMDQYFVINEGTVMNSGSSLNLSKGQIGVFDPNKPTVNGLAAISTFANVPKDKDYIIKVGMSNRAVGRSENNKSKSTFPFSISEIKGYRASAPDSTEQKLDELVVGYNGIDTATAITFLKGERKALFIRLTGEYIGMLGYPGNYVDIEYTMEADRCVSDSCLDPACDSCDAVNCAPIIIDAIEFLKSYELMGGVKLGDVIEINPVKSCTTDPDYIETDYSHYTLEVTDIGDSNSLALVQASYPTYTVTRLSRVGTKSTYELVGVAGLTLTDYSQTIPSILKGCEDCPADYTAAGGGFLYAVSIEDNGTDVTTTVDNLPGFVTGTVVKQGQNFGTGFYTVITDDALTVAEIATFVSSNPSAVVELVNEVSQFCSNATTTDYSWVEGETCKVTSDIYEITVGDTECDTTRLTELQAAFPGYTVVKKGTSKYEITMTGTSGTSTITVNGTAYTSTFDTDLTTTVSNFVTTNAALFLSRHRITLTASTVKLVLTFSNIEEPTITAVNATGNLDGTPGSLTALTTITGGCMGVYQTKAPTNMVCDECSAIYKEAYLSSAPGEFEGAAWTLVAPAPAYADCLCGIKLKGKELKIYTDESLRDMIDYVESSIKIEASGGYVKEFQEGIGDIKIGQEFNVIYLSKAAPRTHVGGRLFGLEKSGNFFFDGTSTSDSYMTRLLKDQESLLKPDTQYVDYVLQIERNIFSQSFMGQTKEVVNYHFLTEYGKHKTLETLLNKLAGSAGLKGVTV